MRSITQTLHTLKGERRRRRVRLPWAELEAEAARQSCSPADIFFDRAGRPVPGLPGRPDIQPARDLARDTRQVPARGLRPSTDDTRSRRQ